jgi:hypothetical protein
MSPSGNRAVVTEELLDLHIEAARQQFDAATIEPAARRLRQKVVRARGGSRRLLRLPALVGTASLVLVAVFTVSLFVPGNDGAAFAQAQQWLSSFRTLRVEATMFHGDSVSTVLTSFDESGDTRVESSDATTIIKPETGMIYILRPDAQNFAQQITSESIVGNSRELLDNIQAFRGQANLLTETRVIEGISAVGYELEGNTGTSVLWVDPLDGKPLLIESQLADGVTTSAILRFDVPLPENSFEIPDEFQLLAPIE